MHKVFKFAQTCEAVKTQAEEEARFILWDIWTDASPDVTYLSTVTVISHQSVLQDGLMTNKVTAVNVKINSRYNQITCQVFVHKNTLQHLLVFLQ